jgi:hypothetical protein
MSLKTKPMKTHLTTFMTLIAAVVMMTALALTRNDPGMLMRSDPPGTVERVTEIDRSIVDVRRLTISITLNTWLRMDFPQHHNLWKWPLLGKDEGSSAEWIRFHEHRWVNSRERQG